MSLWVPQKQRQLLVPVGHKAPSVRGTLRVYIHFYFQCGSPFFLAEPSPDRWKVLQPGSKQEFCLMPSRLQSTSAQLQVSNPFGNLAVVCEGQIRKEGNEINMSCSGASESPSWCPSSFPVLLEPPGCSCNILSWGGDGRRGNCPSRRTPESQD